MQLFSTIHPSRVRHMLLCGCVLLGFLSVNTQVVHATRGVTTTAQQVIVSVPTTTVQTVERKVNDIATTTAIAVNKVATVTTTRPLALKTYRVATTAYSLGARKGVAGRKTADGSYVREGIIAANFLPFGTKVRFPGLFGDRIFEVHDRMHSRYNRRADIWMPSLKTARQFGVKHNVNLEVVEWGTGKKPAKIVVK